MALLKIVGIALVFLIGVILIYLIRVIFLPFREMKEISVPIKNPLEVQGDVDPQRRVVHYEVDGDRIEAWLYLPENIEGPVGCVIMSNGFCGTKGLVMEAYAKKFREAGFAILAYDYRTFGGSSGEPRQLFHVERQYEDLEASIAYARSLEEVDPDKIYLWGTSAAGGYGLVVAAKDKKIAGVIAQCPALDREADGKLSLEHYGMGFYLRLFMHAQRDKGRSRFGLSPHYVPVVGYEDDFAFIHAEGALDGYSQLISPSFENRLCARGMLTGQGLNPIDHASNVDCPVLIQICTLDNLISESSYLDTKEILGDKADLKLYECKHFDIYQGDFFEQSSADEVAFLLEHQR